MHQPSGPFQKMRRALIPAREVIAKKGKAELLNEIEALAEKMLPGLSSAILSYLTALSDGVDLQAIADALQSGDIGKVIGLISAVDTGAAEEAIEDAIHAAVFGGAAAGAAQINGAITGVYFQFDRLNPRLIAWLKSYHLGLIRQINDTTKEAIRDKLTAGMIAGQNPITVAREVKGAIGLTSRQAQAVKNYRKELEAFHTRSSAKGFNLGGKISRRNGRQVYALGEDGLPADGILERRLRDFRFDGQLKRAMATGKPIPPAQIDKMVAAYERKYMRYRAETIARTEALRTTNFGVQDAWRQAIERGKVAEPLVRRRWIVGKDERTCEVCAPIPKMNHPRGVPFDQPFKTPKGMVMLPPVHPNCRCTIFIRAWEPEQLE